MSHPHQPNGQGESRSPTSRLSAFGALDASEFEHLKNSVGPERALEKGAILWREGARLPGVYLLLDGWAASTISVGDNSRQMVKVHMPGDMLGMPSLALKSAAETLVMLSSVKLRSIPLHSLGHLFEAHPRLAAVLFLVSQEERVHLMDRLASVAHTSTMRRAAAMIVQLRARVSLSFPDTDNSFHLPLSRDDLADLIGVTTIEVDRTFEELREMNVVGWSRQRITIIDIETLNKLAGLPNRDLVDDPFWLPMSE